MLQAPPWAILGSMSASPFDSIPTAPAAAFFEPVPGQPRHFQPSYSTIGPWSASHQHGGPPIALLTQALAQAPGGSGDTPMELSRVTVEILGPIPLTPCEIQVDVVRPGKRIELLRAQYLCEGKVVLSALAWRLQRVAGISPEVPHPYQPPPLPAHESAAQFAGMAPFPYGRAMEWRMSAGSFAEPGPATAWARARIPLIEGQATLGAAGLMTMLDSANGLSCELSIQEWTFVPVDLTLNLFRQPIGPWYGMDARTSMQPTGIGMVSTTVFDLHGVVGQSLHTLFIRPMGRG